LVNVIDEMEHHIGVLLWQAAHAWKAAFTAQMLAAGHGWYGEARGGVLQYIDRENGIAQSALVAKMGLSKQAVQKLVIELEQGGIVSRIQDKSDKRAKHIRLTTKGQSAMQDATRIKRALEAQYRANIGPLGMKTLSRLLKSLPR
jgi:DNA-binding MarR family transcriptional regulator